MSKIIVGVMGPGEGAGAQVCEAAFELGALIAAEGWVLLTGGRNTGVMDAANRGARSARGLTVGILPTRDAEGMSEAVDIPIMTGMGEARNNINVLTSRVVIACGLGAGTASEIALALKAGKKVILLGVNQEGEEFLKALGKGDVLSASGPREAIEMAKGLLAR
jgi:uncharacterized protein (TIGR00725 family)